MKLSKKIKKKIVDLIYNADWKVHPQYRSGIDEFYMVDEDEVIDKIVTFVLSELYHNMGLGGAD